MKNIEELIGNTPLVSINQLNKNPSVRIFGKLEGNNPGGSVKDRPALSMFNEAERRGVLKPGMSVIEPTSGNTGIALAMIAAFKGYHIELAMPEDSTAERVKTMRAYGAKITLTPADKSMEGSIDYVKEKIAASGGSLILLNQFDNPDNPAAHYATTGPEIWKGTEGKITHFVSSMGTTGTIMGTSRYLKEQNPGIKIIGVQPADNDSIPGIRKWQGDYLPKIYNPKNIDEIITVSKTEAMDITKKLAAKEGLLAGMSSGGAMAVALRIAETIDEGLIVSIICDRGDRYLSSTLFD